MGRQASWPTMDDAELRGRAWLHEPRPSCRAGRLPRVLLATRDELAERWCPQGLAGASSLPSVTCFLMQ